MHECVGLRSKNCESSHFDNFAHPGTTYFGDFTKLVKFRDAHVLQQNSQFGRFLCTGNEFVSKNGSGVSVARLLIASEKVRAVQNSTNLLS